MCLRVFCPRFPSIMVIFCYVVVKPLLIPFVMLLDVPSLPLHRKANVYMAVCSEMGFIGHSCKHG